VNPASVTTDGLPPEPRSNPHFDRSKAKEAARRTGRPGERCRAEPASHVPVIARGRCEGKAECVAVCPYGVFEVRTIESEDFRALSLLGKLKSLAHGKRTAYTPQADACQACGLCVVACPEEAITLVRTPASG
jgi:NAD-dependent dihydropyrimidine dehydrogenase PreA subunit